MVVNEERVHIDYITYLEWLPIAFILELPLQIWSWLNI